MRPAPPAAVALVLAAALVATPGTAQTAVTPPLAPPRHLGGQCATHASVCSVQPAAGGVGVVVRTAPVRPPPPPSQRRPGLEQPKPALRTGHLATSTIPSGWPEPPSLTAGSWLLIDAGTGQVLAEHEADLSRPVASTIKILTALTALRRTRPDEIVTVGREIEGIGGAGVGLRVGDRLTVRQLLQAIVARSGNDAAVALATHVGGSVDAFVALMRSEAADLGLEDPRIETPSGLDDRNRLSARELATITRAAMAHPAFRQVAGTAVVSLPRVGTLASRNELLGRFPGATGVKTGFTTVAGYSLVASARRRGRELIAVVLDTPTSAARFADATALLEHGFAVFEPANVRLDVRLRVAGAWVPTAAELPPVLVPRARSGVSVDVRVPIEPGDPGEVEVRWNGAPLTTATLESPIASRGPDRPEGGAAVGRWLWDRVYGALRAGTPPR